MYDVQIKFPWSSVRLYVLYRNPRNRENVSLVAAAANTEVSVLMM